MRIVPPLLLLAGLILAAPPARAAGSVIRDIEQRGVVRCGVTFAPGFSAADPSGRPEGLMADFCRALAAAVLGKADAIELRRFAATQDLAAVEHGDVDVSFALNAWTLAGDGDSTVTFGPPVLYDDQIVAGWRQPATRADSPARRTVCVADGSPAALVLADDIARTQKPWQIRAAKHWDDALQLFLGRACDLISAPRLMLQSTMNAVRASADIEFAPTVLAPVMIAPVTAATDRAWTRVVRWVMFALILTDQKDITSLRAAQTATIADDEIRRLFDPGFLPGDLAVAPGWALRAVTQVGNWGEIYARALGAESPYGLARGVNRPWSSGGMLYAPPFQ